MSIQPKQPADSKEIMTFLFSDIEHSTRLAQQLRDSYPEFLERHRVVFREAVQRHQGREIDAAGDGFFIAFDDPAQAIIAAAEIQKVFYLEQWAKDIGLKVRLGIHSGRALSTKSGLTGVEVHYAARICNAAHGGQILISGKTRSLLETTLYSTLKFTALGEYVLKDFSEPIELFQLDIEGLNNQFPPPRTESDDHRLAVLPFRNLNANEDQNYLGEGIAEELILALGKVKGLRVVARSTSFALKDTNLKPQEVGKRLGVEAVLVGEVVVGEQDLKIEVELIDVESGVNMWHGHFMGLREKFIVIQDRITRDIARFMLGSQAPEQHDAVSYRQTHSAEAYDFYLRGRRFYLQFSNRGMDLALQMFARAIEIDASYALAYAGVADCNSFYFQHKAPDQNFLDKADRASKKAIELGPSLAEGFVSRGIVLGLSHEFDEAEHAFKMAIEFDPTLFLGWFHYARLCFAAGRLDKAARLFEQANRAQPEDYQSILLAAQVYHDLHCISVARNLRQEGVAIADHWVELNPGDTRALYFAANAYVFLGEQDKSLKLLRRALILDPGDSMLLYNAGCIYALLDMKSEALTCLERSFKAGLTLRGWYENDSNLDVLREEPRFKALLEKLRQLEH